MDEPVRISDSPGLAAFLRPVVAGDTLAVDLEADAYHRYRERICLVQLSHRGRDAIVDPLEPLDLSRFGEILDDSGVRKVMHGADYDIRLLDRELGFRVAGLFDTMIAARLLGARAFGLAALLREELGVELDKSHQRADWAIRPLPVEMVRYAVEDTRYLEELANRFERRLTDLGRLEWAMEEFERLETVRWTVGADESEAYWKVKGVSALDGRGRSVARELWSLRDAIAKERDVPRVRVFSNPTLLHLAKTRPASLEAVARVRGLSTSKLGPSGFEGVREAIARGIERPPPRSPREGSVRPPARSEAETARLKRLRDLRTRRAEELGIEPSVLGSRKVLEQIVDSGDRWGDAPDLRRWQRAQLAPLVERSRGEA